MARSAHKTRLILAMALLAMMAQAFLGGWALAANANRPMFDAWGNPLCISTDDGSGHGPAQTGMPGCCIIGAGVASGWTPEPSEVNVLDAPYRAFVPVEFDPEGGLDTNAARQTLPGNPRAPPALTA